MTHCSLHTLIFRSYLEGWIFSLISIAHNSTCFLPIRNAIVRCITRTPAGGKRRRIRHTFLATCFVCFSLPKTRSFFNSRRNVSRCGFSCFFYLSVAIYPFVSGSRSVFAHLLPSVWSSFRSNCLSAAFQSFISFRSLLFAFREPVKSRHSPTRYPFDGKRKASHRHIKPNTEKDWYKFDVSRYKLDCIGMPFRRDGRLGKFCCLLGLFSFRVERNSFQLELTDTSQRLINTRTVNL